MPRTTKKKTSKQISKRPVKTKNKIKKTQAINFKTLGNDVFDAPEQILNRLNKLIETQKKKESKLNKALNKIQIECDKTQAKLDVFNEASLTPAIKSRMNKMKKLYAKKYKEQSGLAKEFAKITEELSLLSEHQEKFKALTKCLSTFQKDWANQAKASKKAKTQKVKEAKASKKIATPEQNEVSDQSNESHSFEDTFSEHTNNMDEPVDLAS